RPAIAAYTSPADPRHRTYFSIPADARNCLGQWSFVTLTKMADACAAGAQTVYPRVFSNGRPTGAADVYLRDPSTLKLVQFFHAKGLLALKQEDRSEQW